MSDFVCLKLESVLDLYIIVTGVTFVLQKDHIL